MKTNAYADKTYIPVRYTKMLLFSSLLSRLDWGVPSGSRPTIQHVTLSVCIFGYIAHPYVWRPPTFPMSFSLHAHPPLEWSPSPLLSFPKVIKMQLNLSVLCRSCNLYPLSL